MLGSTKGFPDWPARAREIDSADLKQKEENVVARTREQDHRQRRQAVLENLTANYKRLLGERLAASRKLFRQNIVAIDLHSHSIYSDGSSTVAENGARAKLLGLDWINASDHSTLRQKRSVAGVSNAVLGEESSTGGFHLGLLCPKKLYPWKKGETVAAGLPRARACAPFAWIAHPVGFGGMTAGELDDAYDRLATADELAMEVLNGFNVIDRAYYRTGVEGVRVLDRLLCAGKKVTPVGSSDCHTMVEIGNSWTGVPAKGRSLSAAIKGLQAGCCFATESPLLMLSANGKLMGSTLKPKKGAAVKFRFRVADSAGLASVRIISGGKVVKEIDAKGKPVVEGALLHKATGRAAYFRLETTAGDDRRAFSAPIYLR